MGAYLYLVKRLADKSEPTYVNKFKTFMGPESTTISGSRVSSQAITPLLNWGNFDTLTKI